MIAVIDYGMGNIHSVNKALEFCAGCVCISDSVSVLEKAEKLVLPGVGAFGDAMQELTNRKLISVIKKHIQADKPFLGICLGMQLLFETSQEAPGVSGLGIFKGTVKRFNLEGKLKVPHMGWNQISWDQKNTKEILRNVSPGAYVYFCHSYYPVPDDSGVVAASTEYGINFCSLVAQNKVIGAQFHPEKSQTVGLAILKNFVEL